MKAVNIYLIYFIYVFIVYKDKRFSFVQMKRILKHGNDIYDNCEIIERLRIPVRQVFLYRIWHVSIVIH